MSAVWVTRGWRNRGGAGGGGGVVGLVGTWMLWKHGIPKKPGEDEMWKCIYRSIIYVLHIGVFAAGWEDGAEIC